MKIVQQVQLHFQEGNSDKVYEIDLIEAGEGEFLVNFRYGRRGANLKEGTKTVFPVSYEEAIKVFDKLKKSKTSKGYQEGESLEQVVEAALSNDPDANEARKQQIIEYLKEIAAGQLPATNWSTSRIIWRAGELSLTAALPLLEQVSPADEMEAYSLIWALARCGEPGDQTPVKRVAAVFSSDKIKKLSNAVLLQMGTDTDREEIKKDLHAQLPAALRDAVDAQNWFQLSASLKEYLFELKTSDNHYLEHLYLMGLTEPGLASVFRQVLEDVPMKPNYFKHIRFIFKVAEMLEDSRVHALIARKLEVSSAYYNSPKWHNYAYINGESIDLTNELSKKDARVAFSSNTREYLRRRVNRTVQRKIAAGDKHFTKLATEILLTCTAQDQEGVQTGGQYFYDSNTGHYRWENTYHPPYYQFKPFNAILYTNSDRLLYSSDIPTWRYKDENAITVKVDKREEALPELWDKDPESLVRLLHLSDLEMVQEFAVKAFMANPRKKEHVDLTLILDLLEKPFERSNLLGLDLANELYDPENPDTALILALLRCDAAPARELGMKWFTAHKDALLKQTVFVTELLLTDQQDIQLLLRDDLSVYAWTPDEKRQVADAVLTALVAWDASEVEEEGVKRITDTIYYLFKSQLGQIDGGQLIPLVKSEILPIQLLAGRILADYQLSADELPGELFDALINSELAENRKNGLLLFNKLSDRKLRENQDVIANFCISPFSEIRLEVAPIVERLTGNDSRTAEAFIKLLLPAFYFREKHEGLQQDLLQLFLKALAKHLAKISERDTWKLIRSDNLPANELGHYLLTNHHRVSSLGIREMVELASHDLVALRTLSWDYYQNNVSKVRYELLEAVKITDAKWEDSRSFAYQYFDTHITDEWTPEILISLCDCNRVEVQQYGKRLINRFFQEANGQEYMLKLSQHSNTDMQLFVSGYLDKYAAGDIERINELTYYFSAVLSQVSKGRASKERAFQFIRREAMKDEAVAKWTITLLSRIALTISVTDKAHCISLLHDIQSKYKHLETGITIAQIPVV